MPVLQNGCLKFWCLSLSVKLGYGDFMKLYSCDGGIG